ncbi:MAG TPA: hypothetical protein IAB98_07450 [Candidatus Egerieimonas intestinavium]|uniref:Uncharacterized protein n=1 Tax=Candidatus Egerieimonas intestinavium TaxID=2840777 RepID=A0A9D1JFT0_9FIRM|nr:hypothetical protein [Candidatus Egerieimonas intestinavium]
MRANKSRTSGQASEARFFPVCGGAVVKRGTAQKGKIRGQFSEQNSEQKQRKIRQNRTILTDFGPSGGI